MTFWLVGLCLYETHSVQPSLWDTVYLLVNLPPQHFYAQSFILPQTVIGWRVNHNKRGSSKYCLVLCSKGRTRPLQNRTGTSQCSQSDVLKQVAKDGQSGFMGATWPQQAKPCVGAGHVDRICTIPTTSPMLWHCWKDAACRHHSVLHRNSISLLIIWLCSWRPYICISSERPCLPQALSHNQFITGPRRNVEYASKLPKTWKCVHKLCRKRHDLLADNSYFIQTRQHYYIVGAELVSGGMGSD